MTITIHIGHDKTGSSAVQTALAMNVDLLREHGLEYPKDSNFKDAEQGFISSGNRGAFSVFPEFEDDVDYLFSGEAFVKDIIAGNDIWAKMVQNRSGISRVIVYTRDLFGHFFSQWGQSIKRGGSSRGISVYAREYDVYPKLVKVIDRLTEQGIKVDIFNYSKCRDDIVGHFFKVVLPETAEAFLDAAQTIDAPVNRSLTLAEYELQRHFNRYFGRQSSRFISDMFVNKLPMVKSEKPPLDRETIDLIIDRNGAAAERLNQLLKPEHRLSLELNPALLTTEPGTDFVFSTDQLEVIAQSVSDQIEKFQTRNERLSAKVNELKARLDQDREA